MRACMEHITKVLVLVCGINNISLIHTLPQHNFYCCVGSLGDGLCDATKDHAVDYSMRMRAKKDRVDLFQVRVVQDLRRGIAVAYLCFDRMVTLSGFDH